MVGSYEINTRTCDSTRFLTVFQKRQNGYQNLTEIGKNLVKNC